MIENDSYSVSMKSLMPIILNEIESGKECTLKVKGFSMYPFLKEDRDFVHISSLKDRTIEKGDIVFFKRSNGQFVMHRVFDINNEEYDFLGDNQIVLERGIKKEQLVAYVPVVIRKGKKINCDNDRLKKRMIHYMNFKVNHPKLFIFICRVVHYIKKPFWFIKHMIKE